jgi:hypothetical protein
MSNQIICDSCEKILNNKYRLIVYSENEHFHANEIIFVNKVHFCNIQCFLSFIEKRSLPNFTVNKDINVRL